MAAAGEGVGVVVGRGVGAVVLVGLEVGVAVAGGGGVTSAMGGVRGGVAVARGKIAPQPEKRNNSKKRGNRIFMEMFDFKTV